MADALDERYWRPRRACARLLNGTGFPAGNRHETTGTCPHRSTASGERYLISANGRTRTLLAHSYYLRYDPKQMRKMKPYPPLATLIAASVLREKGFEVHLFDAMLAAGVEEFYTTLDDVKPSIVGIVEDNFNFLTKMCTVRMREAALDMIRAAKAMGCRVAVSSPDTAGHAGLYLKAGADAVIVQEPEHAFTDLVELWSSNSNAGSENIPGLALRTFPIKPGDGNGHLRQTAARPFIQDLDSLPFPAWDLVDVERYRSVWTKTHGHFSWNVVTSRGCPYRCNWCAKPLFGTRYAQRSAGNVAEELRRLRESVIPDHVWFADDIFGLTSRWIEAFSREVIARDARIPFMMQSRVSLMKPEVVAALAEAGAQEVWLGVESGSQKVLDAMDKGTKIEQVRAATRTLKEHGIRTCWFIQLGYLGEEWEDIILTRDLIREERPDDIGVSVSYPLPGSKFYELVKGQLGAKSNWNDSDDLAMMFQGTYGTQFYKMARDLLHHEVNAGLAGDHAASHHSDDEWNDLARREGEFRASHAPHASGG